MSGKIDKRAFMLEMQDDSMIPHIEKGDILYVEKTNKGNNGDTMVVFVKNDNTGVVRKIFAEADYFELYATNGDYQSKRYYREEVEIIGKVLFIEKEPRWDDELKREKIENKRIKKSR